MNRRPLENDAMGKPPATDVQVVTSGDEGMGVRKGAASATGTWGDKVRATTPPPENITAEMARTAHMLEGVWNPLHIKQLTNTLLTDWNSPENEQWTQNEIAMRLEAQAPLKHAAIKVYAVERRGKMKSWRPMVEDMHEAYHNAMLTAVVPTTVKLTKTAAHAVIFKELFMANKDKRTGHKMMRALQRDVKRMTYDGIQTLKVVFYSRTAANRWEAKALRLQNAVIVLKDTQRSIGQEATGLYTAAQLEIQYAVRVYGGECLGLTALARAFASFTDAKVLDVEYARETRTNIYDNRYRTIRFAQQDCPAALRGVSMIRLNDTDITLHHFQQNLRRPCSRCLSPKHGTMRCTLAGGKVKAMRAKATRVMAGKVEMKTPPSSMDFRVNSLQALVNLLSKQQTEQQLQSKLLAVAETEFGTEARVEEESDQTNTADPAAHFS
ncbi:unnamed protein product [Phytophthora fragariaefolia]|uniref:Unnamed protein product n=1 Tax=Phytophthora fragariaefolia TaxID=1490495 RepID=A0A9W7DBM3_9STRA|nr:unnamed protein product [Phytophthora fragariaefolia]